MKREYSAAELDELVRTVRTARATPRGPSGARTLFVVMAACVGVLLVGMVLAAFLPSGVIGLTPFTTSALGLLIAAYVLVVWLRRGFLKRVRSRAFLVCLNCHYDLADEPSERDAAFCPNAASPTGAPSSPASGAASPRAWCGATKR